jgi:endonuclease/exonuclease/phosphatase family metal-dependent hydrolase
MKLMTYNIRGWRTMDDRPNLSEIGDVIAAVQPDIVGLNEVFHPRVIDGHINSHGSDDGVPALEVLAQRLGMNYVFGPCMRWPAQDDMPASAYGNAVLSRWPIVASAGHHLTAVEGKEQRGLLEARIELPNGRSFTVYQTHLGYSDEDVSLIQLRSVRAWTVRDRNRPHVVMGDFNAVSLWDFEGREQKLVDLSHHPKGSNLGGGEKGPRVVAQMQKAGYADSYRLFSLPANDSYIPATDQPIRIDYIFASKPLVPHVTGCQIWCEEPGAEASDHRPVIAEIEDTDW